MAGSVINDAGAAAALDQHPPVEEIADIGFVGDADHRRTDNLGRPDDRRIAGSRQLRVGCRRRYFLFDLRERIRNGLADKKGSIAHDQAAADHCAQDRDNE